MTPKQQERLGKLLSMGIPLPLAFPLAMDPRGSSIAAQEVASGVDKISQKVEDVLSNPKKAKRKVSAYSKKYKKAFDQVKDDFMTKSGKWKKGGFRKAVKAAHKAVKK